MKVNYFISALKELGIDIKAKLNELVNNLIMQFGIEYIVESRESLEKFICGVVIGVDDNLFLGTVRTAAKLVQVVKDELPEDNYSFMIGKVIMDVMFISYFEKKANEETEKALIFTSIALVSAEVGALLFIPTAGVSEAIVIPITMRSIQIAIKSLVVGALADAGAMHSQSLLNDDQSKLKKAKRDKGAAEAKYLTNIEGKVTAATKANLPEWVAESFTDGSYRTVVTNDKVTLYRTFGGRADAGGGFATTMPSANRIQAKIDAALLSEWRNTRMYEAVIEVPKDQVLNIGKVAEQYTKTGTKLAGQAD